MVNVFLIEKNFSFYTTKISAQEYVNEVEKTGLSGEPSRQFAD